MRGGVDAENGALVLIGDYSAFRQFTSFLRSNRAGVIPLEPVEGRAALRPIGALHVKPAEHAAVIIITGEAATISASEASYGQLADEIELFLEYNDLTEPGMHAHVEAICAPDGIGVLDVRSVELILAGPVSDETL